jgi:phosphatidylglycerophosphate synthase
LSPRPLLIDAGWQLASLGGAVAAAAMLLVPVAGLGWRGVVATLAAYAVIAALVLWALPQHAPHRRFGLANALTLARAAYVALLLGAVVEGLSLAESRRWALVLSGVLVLLLDGADGWTARRTGMASPFGARFDMEVDALFVLALTMLVARAGIAGGWVVISGLLRYLFVLAGFVWPVLALPLPASSRRKALCVVQILALLAALAPPAAPVVTWLCLGGLLLLVYSFAVDIVQLMGVRRVAARITT